MSPLCPLPPGTQLYNDYGPLPRSDLLRRYGYITPGYAVYDVVEIRSDLATDIILSSTGTKLPEEEKRRRIEYLLDEEVLDDAFDLGIISPEDGGEEGEDDVEDATAKLTKGKVEIPPEWAAIYHVLTLPFPSFSKPAPLSLPSSSLLKRIKKSPKYKSTIIAILKTRLDLYNPPPPPPSPATPLSIPAKTQRRLAMAKDVRLGEINILETALRGVEGWEAIEGEGNGPGKNKEAETRQKRKADGGDSGSTRKRVK